MEKEFKNIEQWEAHLRGELTEAEMQEMQQRLASDEGLNAEFEAFTQLVEGARTVGDLHIRQAIAQAHSESRKQGFLLTEDDLTDYLRGKLDESTSAILELRMQSDTAFAEDMNRRTELLEGIRTKGDLDIRAQIRQAGQQAKSEGILQVDIQQSTARIVTFRQKMVRWAAAASVALLAIAGAWWYLVPSKYDEAFAAHYQPNPPMLNSLLDSLESAGFAAGKGEAYKAYLAGVQAYEAGEFVKSESPIAAWLQQNPGDDNARLLLGLNYLGQQSYKKAAGVFEQLLASQDAAIARTAKFYLALSWCKLPFKRGMAQRLLAQIANDKESPHRQAAAMMLRNINR